MKGLVTTILVLMLALIAVNAVVTPAQAEPPRAMAMNNPSDPPVVRDTGDIGITHGDGDDIGGGDEVDPPPALREVDPRESGSAQVWWEFISRVIQSLSKLRSI